MITRKKGEKIHMYAFTGMYLGEFEITASDKKTISIVQKNGKTTTFDRETGKQMNAKTPRCSSYVSEEKTADNKKNKKKATKKPITKKAAAKKAPKPEAVDEEEDIDDDEYEDA